MTGKCSMRSTTSSTASKAPSLRATRTSNGSPSQIIWASRCRTASPRGRQAAYCDIGQVKGELSLPSLMDDGADQVEEHHPRNERQAGDARAGAALSASWRRLARKTRPRLPPVEHRAVRERLLLAFAPLPNSAT